MDANYASNFPQRRKDTQVYSLYGRNRYCRKLLADLGDE